MVYFEKTNLNISLCRFWHQSISSRIYFLPIFAIASQAFYLLAWYSAQIQNIQFDIEHYTNRSYFNLFFIKYRGVANEQINYGLVINSPLNINDTVELSLLEHHWRVGNCINESIKDRFINYLEFLNLGLIKHGEYIRCVSLGASPMFLLWLCAGHLWSLKQRQKPEYNPQINISMYMYLAKHSIERCDNMTNFIITLVNMICCIRDTDV